MSFNFKKNKQENINENYGGYETNNEAGEKQLRFYQKNWFIILMLFFCAPIGIFLLWRYGKWSKVLKLFAAILSLVWFLFVIFSEYPPSPDETSIPNTYPTFTERETDETFSAESTSPSEIEEESVYPDTTAKSEISTSAPEHTKAPTEIASPTEKATVPQTQPKPIGNQYVLNTNTKVYHRPNCRYVEKIKPEHYLLSSTVPSNYRPCKVCKP